MSYPTIAVSPSPFAFGRSAALLWIGRTLSTIAVLFLLFDGTVKLLKLPIVLDTTAQIGYATSTIVPLGLLELALLVVYLIPRLAPVGAILWTAYLGGAVATHVRIGSPLFSHILFPTYVAALLWAGLCLRDARVRTLLGGAR